MNTLEKVSTALAILIVVLSWVWMAGKAVECSASGGTLVRGIFLLECIHTNTEGPQA